jgi:hypothetical protein
MDHFILHWFSCSVGFALSLAELVRLEYSTKPDAMLVWAPSPDLPDSKVDEYTTIAKERHGYNTEQVKNYSDELS